MDRIRLIDTSAQNFIQLPFYQALYLDSSKGSLPERSHHNFKPPEMGYVEFSIATCPTLNYDQCQFCLV